MSSIIRESCFLVHRITSRKNALIRRYASVAHDLPEWAKEVLSSKMGNIEVSARDSFEIYLTRLNGVKPKNNYIIFCKQFAEIFDRRAYLVLKKIKKNREAREEFYVSNEYFWQEFRDLFVITPSFMSRFYKVIFEIERNLWVFINLAAELLRNLWRHFRQQGFVGRITNFLKSSEKKGVNDFKIKYKWSKKN